MYKFYKHTIYDYVQIAAIPLDDIEKIDFALCKEPTETPDSYYRRQAVKPDFITNGGFFSMTDGQTCFGFRDEGVSIGIAEYSGVGIVGDKKLVYGQNLKQESSLRDFISAYPPLVEYGHKITPTYAKEIDYNARRTAIGWNDTEYFIVVVDNPGLRLNSLANIFISLGAKFAINLDGGGSTRLLLNGVRKTELSYARPVDNVMCVYLKKDEPKSSVLYRVQVGAFSVKANADKLLADLKSKGFTEAYVRQIDKMYKVQLGAFSVKLNAERLKDRLIALGYRSVIVQK